MRKHWRRLLPGDAGGSRASRSANTRIGWLNWLGADAIGVAVALLNILWVPVVAFANIAVPDRILTMPIMAAFAVSVAHFVALYRLRVRGLAGQMLGAVCAAMSLQWTVARAVGMGVVKEHVPFLRTAKGGTTRKGPDFPAFWEAVIAALLLIGALTLVVTNYKQVREINIFALVLVVQSLPFLAAVALAAIEGHALQQFAYWRGIEAKVAGLSSPARRAKPQVHCRAPKVTVDNGAVTARADKSSARQRGLREPHPIGRADRDRLVVEIVSRVVQARAVAVADEDEGARPLVAA